MQSLNDWWLVVSGDSWFVAEAVGATEQAGVERVPLDVVFVKIDHWVDAERHCCFSLFLMECQWNLCAGFEKTSKNPVPNHLTRWGVVSVCHRQCKRHKKLWVKPESSWTPSKLQPGQSPERSKKRWGFSGQGTWQLNIDEFITWKCCKKGMAYGDHHLQVR